MRGIREGVTEGGGRDKERLSEWIKKDGRKLKREREKKDKCGKRERRIK